MGTVKIASTTAEFYGTTCNLSAQAWIFIIATGRSGSTSIMETLNGFTPAVYLTGETAGAIGFISQLPYFPNNAFPNNFIDGQIGYKAFRHKPVSKHSLYCWVQGYFQRLIDPKREGYRYIGFKTIRIISSIELDFMKEVFPAAKFVMSYRRDLAKQYRSREMNAMEKVDLEERTKLLKLWSLKNSDISYRLPLEKFSVSEFNKLQKWIRIKKCTLSTISHANANGFKDDSSSVIVNGICV